MQSSSNWGFLHPHQNSLCMFVQLQAQLEEEMTKTRHHTLEDHCWIHVDSSKVECPVLKDLNVLNHPAVCDVFIRACEISKPVVLSARNARRSLRIFSVGKLKKRVHSDHVRFNLTMLWVVFEIHSQGTFVRAWMYCCTFRLILVLRSSWLIPDASSTYSLQGVHSSMPQP